MKKLISATLAVTMLLLTLVNPTCFADKAKESNIQCVQNKDRSKPCKEKKFDSKKAGKILAGVTAGTAALTGVTAAALKLAEDKLPKNIKSKLLFLYTKKSQESQENIEKEKTSETISEPETTKNETFETSVTNSTISKNENAKIVASESETKKTELIDSKIRKPETVKNITTKPAATNSLAIANNTKTAIIQPTKINTTSNNIKPATKSTVNASTVTSNIITNRTIYTNATNRFSNLNKTSENLLSSDTSGKTLTKTLLISAAILGLTAAVALAFLHPNLRNSFSQNFEKLKKECNKLGATLGAAFAPGTPNPGTNPPAPPPGTPNPGTNLPAPVPGTPTTGTNLPAPVPGTPNPAGTLPTSEAASVVDPLLPVIALGVAAREPSQTLTKKTKTNVSHPAATGLPPITLGKPLHSMPDAEPDSNQKTLPTETAVAATSEGTTTHHHTAMASAATAGTAAAAAAAGAATTAVTAGAGAAAAAAAAAAGTGAAVVVAPGETITESAYKTIMSNEENSLNILLAIKKILRDSRKKTMRRAYEHCLGRPLPHNAVLPPEIRENMFNSRKSKAKIAIEYLKNNPDTANDSVLQQSEKAFKRLSALKAVVICSTIPGNEAQTKDFFKQLGMSEQPNKEEIEKEALRLTNKLEELLNIADILPPVDSPPPLDPEISDALYSIQREAPNSKKEYIERAEEAVQDLHRAQQEQENQSTNSAPQNLSRLTLRKREALDQIIKLFNLPDKEAQDVARNLFNESGLGPNVVEEINQECEDKIQKNKEKVKILQEALENPTLEGISLREARERYHQINWDLDAYRQATYTLNTQRINDETDTSLRVLTMADSLTPLPPEAVLDLQRYYLYNYLTTMPNAAVAVCVPTGPSFRLPSNALGALLRLPTCAPNLVLRIPNSAADAVTRLPSSSSTDEQSFLTLEALELPEASTATPAAETTAAETTTETMSETAETPKMTSSVAEIPETASDVTETPETAADVTEIPETASETPAEAAGAATPASTGMSATPSVRVPRGNPLSRSV